MAHATTISVRVTPRAGRDEIGTFDAEGVLRIRVAAPPVDGAANEAIVRLIAAALGVPRPAVRIVAGASSRHKRVRIEGVDAARIQEVMRLALG